MSDPHPHCRSRLALILGFVVIADVFWFLIVLAVTANVRLAVIVPAVFGLSVLAPGITRSTRMLAVATVVPLDAGDFLASRYTLTK